MYKILKMIVEMFSAALEENDFKMTGFSDSGNRFNGSSIIFSSADFEIFISIERDEISIEFRSLFDARKGAWYSAEMILELLGCPAKSGASQEEIAGLIRDNFSRIVRVFRKDEAKKTLSELTRLNKRGK